MTITSALNSINVLRYQTFADGLPADTSEFCMMQYGINAGWTCQPTLVGDLYAAQALPHVLLSGGVSPLQSALSNVGIVPRPIDYPVDLTHMLDRDISTATMGDLRQRVGAGERLFAKSVKQKHMTGKVFNSTVDLLNVSYVDDDCPVYISDVVDLSKHREWRCYFVDGEVFDIRPYNGFLDAPAPKVSFVQSILNVWRDKPASGSIDIATSYNAPTAFIECNDGFALGNYGMFNDRYALLLATRWYELHREGR